MRKVKDLLNGCIWIMLCASTFFASCSEKESEPPEPPEPAVFNNYIEFKYNGKEYKIANDENCIFTRHAEDYHVITGSTASSRQAFTLTIWQQIEPGESYDIYTSSPYVAASITFLFTEGETLAEEGFAVTNITQVGVIGKLSITELTEERMSGTFSCKTTHGEITDGKFTVKARVYE
jgi:hypothetical protein